MNAPFWNKRRFFWLLGAFVALVVVLLVTLTILLPRFINSADFKKRIATRVSEQMGGRVTFEAVDLSIFPLLHVVIRQASLTIPAKTAGTIESLHVYSEILPLLTGKVRISKVHLNAPDFDLNLPPMAEKQAAEPPAFSLDTLRGQLPSQLDFLAAKAPGLVVSMEKARVRFLDGDRRRFVLTGINGRVVLPPESVQIDIACGSDFWEKASVRARLRAEDLTGEARMELTNFRPGRLAEYLTQADAPLGSESVLGLTVDVATDRLRDVKGAFQGSIPNLTIPQEGEDLVIRAKTLAGTFELDEDKTLFSLTELRCDYPEVDTSASLMVDRAAQQVSFKIEGRDVDVASTRRTVLGLAGGVPAVRKVFEIVRGGQVPLVTIETRGGSFADLKKLDNMRIEGRMLDGKVRPPTFTADVEDVRGDVVIAKGILEGQNLVGRRGTAWGRNGTLRVGLKGKDGPLQLDIEIEESDISTLPAELSPFIKSASFRNEMKRIKGLQGKATGRLTLGETLAAIKTRVEVSQLSLSARYDRIPFPVKISEGAFSFGDGAIAVKGLRGRFGKTSFAKLAATLGLKKEPILAVESGAFRIAMEEIFSWLSSIQRLNVVLGDLAMERFTGVIRFRDVKIKGPLLAPERWNWDARGDVRDLAVKTGLFPAEIKMPAGKFHLVEEAERQQATLKDAQFMVQDSSLTVSGTLDDYYKGLNRVDITLTGSVGAESIEGLSDYVDLPTMVDLKWSPMSFPSARLLWERDRMTSFEGDLVIDQGPNIALSLLLKPDELHIKNLLIQDQESRATFTLHARPSALEFRFGGNLTQATLDRIFLDTEFRAGRMKGDLQANINLTQLTASTAQGSLMAQDFVMPVNQEEPVRIEEVALMADGSHVRVDSGRFSCGENIIALIGDLTVSPEGLTLDLDVSSPEFDLERIQALFESEDEDGEPDEPWEAPKIPLQGELRFKTDTLKVKDFIWRPFQADVTFGTDRVLVKVPETSELCGIAIPGTLEFTPQQISLAFQPAAEDKELEATIDCIFAEERKIKGRFDFKADISAEGEVEGLLKALEGDFEYYARDGHYQKDVAMKRLLGFLNITEVFKGKVPDFEKEGFKFNSMKLRGVFQEGKLTLQEGALDSPNMRIACSGNIDYIEEQLNLKILVAPLKTVDSIVNIIPLIRRIFNQGLVTVPVSLTGPWKDPKVETMAAKDVGEGLVGIMKNTVTLPVTIFEPIMPKAEGKKPKKDVGAESGVQSGK
jgi:hypothetical protein